MHFVIAIGLGILVHVVPCHFLSLLRLPSIRAAKTEAPPPTDVKSSASAGSERVSGRQRHFDFNVIYCIGFDFPKQEPIPVIRPGFSAQGCFMRINRLLLVGLAAACLALYATDLTVLTQSRSQKIPPHASSDGFGGRNCDDGFLKRAQLCVALADASDTEIRQHLIDRSIESSSGSCPCPYNTDRAGRRCGGRSAYSRPGGASPLCYQSDISDERVKQFRSRYSAKKQ